MDMDKTELPKTNLEIKSVKPHKKIGETPCFMQGMRMGGYNASKYDKDGNYKPEIEDVYKADIKDIRRKHKVPDKVVMSLGKVPDIVSDLDKIQQDIIDKPGIPLDKCYVKMSVKDKEFREAQKKPSDSHSDVMVILPKGKSILQKAWDLIWGEWLWEKQLKLYQT